MATNRNLGDPAGASMARVALNRRLRAAFIEGAERQSQSSKGRGLTAEELERVLRRYPGDVELPSASGADPPP